MKRIIIFCCLLLAVAGCRKKTCGADSPPLKATKVAGQNGLRMFWYGIAAQCDIRLQNAGPGHLLL